jgi:hypothetical protein
VRYLTPFTCETKAYTSVVLAAGSSVIRGASIWLDAKALPRLNEENAHSAVMARTLRGTFIYWVVIYTLR